MYSPQKSKAVTAIGLLGIITGAIVIIGWVFNMHGLQSIYPQYVSMRFNTALCFILLGTALLITQAENKNNLFFLIISVLITLFGTLSLSQDIFHFNAGIDQLFITDKLAIADKYPFPGRMAANVSACFALFGLAFIGFTTKSRVIHILSQYALHLVTAISAVALLGYLFGLSLFYNLSYVSSMAVHTAILFFFMSIIASLLHPSLGITNLFTGHLVGNRMARRIFILIVLMILIFGSFRLQSQRFEIFSFEIGISLLALSFLIVSLAITWHTAIWLNKVDLKRYEAEEEIKVMNEELERRVEERSADLLDLLEKFRESESRFRAAFEFSAIGMALVLLDGSWLKVNESLCEMVGHSEQELLSLSFMDITHPDDIMEGVNLMKKAATGENRAYHIEKRYLNKNGTIVWANVNMATVTDHNNRPLYLVCQIEDITERKLVEARLKKSEEEYRLLIEHASDAIYVLDLKGNFTDANESMCKMTGYSKNELLHLNIVEIVDPEQLKTDPIKHGPFDPEISVIRERRLISKHGKKFDVEINVKMFNDDKVLVIARDITDRKQMEYELREAELKFRTLAEKSMVGVYISQKERFIYVNPRFAEIFGYEPHELINTDESAIKIIISEKDQAVVRKNVQSRYKGDIDIVNYEVTGKKKDGTHNRIEFYGSRVIIDGEPSIIGSMLDVTERRKAEDVLKRSEANLKTIMDTTDTAYALMDKKLNVMAFNQMAIKFVTSQYNHIPVKGDKFADYFPKERFPQFISYTDEVLKGRNISYEINYPKPDGSAFWYYVRLFPITNDKKEIFGLMLALSDITERKTAEESLKTAYKQIQEHINSIKDMAWKQSHLIRSPLANLKGLAEMLKEDPSDNDVLKFIHAELDRLDAVIIEMAEDASNHNL
jgi:two-component system, sporulation sensor kinase E